MKKMVLTSILYFSVMISPFAMADDAPKTGISYKGVNITLGGFLASETVYRTNTTGSDIGTSYSKLPFNNSSGYGEAEFRGTERQSRFSLLAQGDVDASTHIAGYYELDFLGAAPTANDNESSSFNPRTRNVYMTVDWEDSGWHLLAGQNWSLVTLDAKGITPRTEMIPTTIDAQYAVGFNWARQWQVRLAKDWSKTYWAAISLENSQTAGVAGSALAGTGNNFQVATPGALQANDLSFNSFPDIIAKFAADPGFGHYEIYGLARNFESRYGGTTDATKSNKQSVWTEAIGAGVIVPVLPAVLDFTVSGLFGKGIGRYGTASMSDATFASDGSLQPLSGKQYLAQLAWHANSQWEAYLSYGQESLDASKGAGYGYGDGIATTQAGCSNLGGTCAPNLKSVTQSNIGFWWSFYKGDYGTAKLGAQYSHTAVNTYADNGGLAPTTNEDMVFTSLRFYPF